MKGSSIRQGFGRLRAIMVMSKLGVVTLVCSSSSAYAQTQTCFDYTGSIETWQVPAGVTTVTAEAWGAEGGDSTWSTFRAGGLGAYVKGDVSVTPGDQLKILVGGEGGTGTVGGGGGGSFLATSADSPLLVAGGGGGASSDDAGVDGAITQSGTADSVGAVSGGSGGNGGNVCGIDQNDGGGGGGFSTDGADANSGGTTVGGFGGIAFVNGGTIVPHGRLDGACVGPAGGFGGGGSATCNTVGGGGGGGYSGGAGGQHFQNCLASTPERAGGGGGGSFNSGVNQTNTPGVRSGNGRICLIPGAAAPTVASEPPQPVPVMPLYGLGVMILGVLAVTRRKIRSR